MSAALHVFPDVAAAATPAPDRRTSADDEFPDADRRTTARRTEPERPLDPADDVRLAEFEPEVEREPDVDVEPEEARPGADDEPEDASWRRAAWTPASAADQPTGRSARGTERRVTGPTAAPGRGRTDMNDGTRVPSPACVADDADPDADEVLLAAVDVRRSEREAATPAAAAWAPMGAAFMEARVRRAMAAAADAADDDAPATPEVPATPSVPAMADVPAVFEALDEFVDRRTVASPEVVRRAL